MPDANGLQLPARVNWTASTVSISDFDSLEQAMAWRRFGPEAAIHRFIMKLRMALLSADYVYVDRNQLLDGICFLSLGPDGIAEALGIPRFQDLPLVVGCEAPTPPAGGFARPGDAQERTQWIALQRSRVESETFVSAAYAALNASGDTEASAASARRAQLCTLLADLEECDSEDIGSYPAYVRLPRRRREAEVLVATGRDQWQSAMESLRVHLISWPQTPSVEEVEFWERHGRIEDLEDPEARSIALTLRAWLPEWIRSNGGHVARPARRGDVVALLAHWMNNAAPQDLEVPGGQVYRGSLTAPHARCALRWFSLLYEDAATQKRLALLDAPSSRMSFTIIATDSGDDDPETRAQRQWGMCVRPLSRGQMWRARLLDNARLTLANLGVALSKQALREVGAARGLSVNGEITEAMATLTPEQYQRVLIHPMTKRARDAQKELTAASGASPAQEIRAKRLTRNSWRSLALFIREFAIEPLEWRKRVMGGGLRCLAVTALAFILTAHDSGWFGPDSFWMNVMWTGIAFLASFPYSDIHELLELRPSRMMSEIRLAEA